MLFKLATCAESSFRRIKGFDWLAQVISGVQFVDGIKQDNKISSKKPPPDHVRHTQHLTIALIFMSAR